MIHTLYIDETTEVSVLRRDFRKLLMTGGAVIRLKPNLTADQLRLVFQRFREGVERNNVCWLVLREIGKVPGLPQELQKELAEVEL